MNRILKGFAVMPMGASVNLEKARFNEELLQRIGDATPDLIFAKDTSGRMIFANAAVLRMIGKPWEEVCGRGDIDWHNTPEQGRRFQENDLRVMAAGVSESSEE